MPPSSPMLLRAAAAAVLAAGLLAAGVAPASAATAPPPGLSITISNDQDTVAADSDATYTITVGNTGTSPATAWVVATVPAFTEITDAGDAGTVDGPHVTWKLDLDEGKTTTRNISVHVGTIPESTYRVTVLTNLYLTDNTTVAPVIGSADSDRIPGVTEPTITATPTPAPGNTSPDGQATLLAVIGIMAGAAVLLCLAAVILVIRRRRGRRQDDGRRDSSADADADATAGTRARDSSPETPSEDGFQH